MEEHQLKHFVPVLHRGFWGADVRLLPITGSLLRPKYSTEGDAQDINRQKQRQQYYYNRHVKQLKLEKL